ncbi:sperm-associated antigen 1 [Salminus brasiliensis]|uniref:sperm-associated antigen 1 n=1 Tax=Salminus brasiliensis TaxID=930266 RepID=UPI003B8382BD
MSLGCVSSTLLHTQSASSSTHSVPVEHLDYRYIETCSDLKYLEKILGVLRSGKEGIYPHLTEFCEKHIEKLDPRSRALRKENSPATEASFSDNEWSQITSDLQTWEREMRINEAELKHLPLFCDGENIPPVRGSNCSVQKVIHNGVKATSKKRHLPRAYQDWDKFDVEKECAKIDGSVTKNESPAIINDGLPKIQRKIDTTALTEQEKVVLANHEKDKGNEAFRSSDYEEAVAYYTRSLYIMPTTTAYNNRAQAEIKLQRWNNALNDCERVLQLEPHNTKALLRRATAHKQLENLQMAHDDITAVLRLEPHNMTAQRLLEEITKKINADKPNKGKKLLIQEVEDEEDDDDDGDDTKYGMPADGGQSAGEDRQAAVRGGMGNAQKKAQSGGARGPTADKYKVKAEGEPAAVENRKSLANGSGGGSSTARPSTGRPDSPVGERERTESNCASGALPPPLARLKNEGNQLFKNGQFGDALEKYTQAITGFTEAGIDSPEDLCILYSNRAACYLKDGNSSDCIADCSRALELKPFSLKPLLRRAMAYESMERYRKAYVDNKTVLQIDSSIQAAHDSVNRITRLLIEQDGADWRQKLPEIPVVPLSLRQHHTEPPPSTHIHKETDTQEAARSAETRFTSLKTEGNELVKKGQYQEAVGKYSECLKLKSDECAIYTNRALCFIKLERFAEAKQDCDSALKLESSNKKAFYRRALANKGLKDYEACSSDLQAVLRLDSSVQEAERELEEVTALLKQQRAKGSPSQPRRDITITELEEEDEEGAESSSDGEQKSTGQSINLQPSNAYEFGQALNAARSHNDTTACAQLLRTVPPDSLPQYVSTQLDAHTLSFIMQTLDTQLLTSDPGLVYQLLDRLHTAERFSVVLMLLDSDERKQMTQLFEHLCSVDSETFSQNDVKNLANKYI